MDPQPPLVVDLDGTLVKTDMLLETLVGALQRAPWLVFVLPFWLLRGRAAVKRELALRSNVPVEGLPYRTEVLDWVRSEHEAGRRVVLATAADESIARRIADHVGAFDEILASDGERNVKGEGKRAALVERFGERGFDYAGNESADLGVWGSARCAIVVSPDPALLAAAARSAPQVRQIAVPSSGWAAVGRAIRVHQWPKNLLVFVPLALAHRAGDPQALLAACVAFLAFCFVASAVYLVNDLVDLEADRLHLVKRARPLAAGEVSIVFAVAMVPMLLLAGAALAVWVNAALLATVAGYGLAGFLYSAYLKRIAVLDIFVIAGLYSIRLQGGASAVDVPVSDWLFAFSMFFFLSLALAKRHAELKRLSDSAAQREDVPGRGYRHADTLGVGILGAVSGYLAVVVLAFYVTSHEVAALYTRPGLLWGTAVLMLFWISRTWLLAHRGELGEDPLSFALRDPASYAVGVLALLTLVAAA
jgi:4-hydroxybenzoate polyprenyltransferase/phosphoserine phosphatase